MKLDEYLHRQRLTNVAFAASIGVDQSTIARLRKGDLMPSGKLSKAIFDATGGKVTPNDLYGLGGVK